jgi:hypothetical protein
MPKSLKPCKAGKERNPLTGRCVKECEIGQERSLLTGRCVKECEIGQEKIKCYKMEIGTVLNLMLDQQQVQKID